MAKKTKITKKWLKKHAKVIAKVERAEKLKKRKKSAAEKRADKLWGPLKPGKNRVTSTAQFPEIMQPLFIPMRYKVMYGGRGGTKSWGYSRALLTLGMQSPLRILCAREIMETLKESVFQLLLDQIGLLGYEGFYTSKENEIRGKNGTQFLFAGLRQMDAAKIKSFEGADICWVEEAQTVSKKSWNILIPTIRKENSEIWVSFNPDLDTDDTYVRFVVNTPPNSWVQEVSYRDNPWRTKVLEQERLHMKKVDPEEYSNIWDGKPKTVLAGAVYAKEVVKMVSTKRIRPVPYDPQLPVHAIWDMGWNDQTAIVLVQRLMSEVRIIGYLECSFMTYAEWVAYLKAMPYVWGYDWLPHDAAHHTQETGKSAKKLIRKLGRKVKMISVAAPASVEVGIKAVRMMFPRLYIDNSYEMDGAIHVGGGRLVECLKRYRRSVPASTDEPAGPVHDQYSHGADAVRGLAMIVDKIRNEDEDKVPEGEDWGQSMRGVM